MLKPGQTLAAIIPTYRRWDHLLSTIEQLLEQTRIPHEIVIVDQTPKTEVTSEQRDRLRRLRQRHGRLMYCHQPQPHVYRARNVAARMSTAATTRRSAT